MIVGPVPAVDRSRRAASKWPAWCFKTDDSYREFQMGPAAAASSEPPSRRSVRAYNGAADLARVERETTSTWWLGDEAWLSVMTATIGDSVQSIPGEQAHFELPTENGELVSFHGTLIASESSREPYGERSKFWRDVALYRRADGKYVVHSVGRTAVPGKTDRHSVYIAADARAVYAHLVPRGQRPRFLIEDVLQSAGQRDPALARAVGDQLDIEDLASLPGDGDVVELPRAGDRWLRFRGVRLAQTTSWDEGKPSWTEIEIYRAGSCRYVVFKAQRLASRERKEERVWVVHSGRDALKALIRPGATWLEAAALDAVDEAASADREFASTVDELLEGGKFRELLPAQPRLSSAQRDVLQMLEQGGRLVTETIASTKSRVARWSGTAAVETPLPVWPLFLKLSRQRLIRTVQGSAPATTPGTTEWEISDLGRAALRSSK